MIIWPLFYLLAFNSTLVRLKLGYKLCERDKKLRFDSTLVRLKLEAEKSFWERHVCFDSTLVRLIPLHNSL